MLIQHRKARAIAFVASLALVLILVGGIYSQLLSRMRGITRPEVQARLSEIVIRSGIAAATVSALLLAVLCVFLLWRLSHPSRILLGVADAAILMILISGPAVVSSISSKQLSFQGFMEPWVDTSPLIVTLPSTAAVLGALVFWVTAVRRSRPVKNAA